MSDFEVLYEDQDLLAIAKPPGVVVNDADTLEELTIQTWFADRQKKEAFPTDWQTQVPADFSDEYGSAVEIFEQRAGIVHRLDRDTSGVLLLAKHPGSLVSLLRQFKERTVEKEYICLVHGKMKAEHDVISLPLGRARRDRKLFAVVPGGRHAETEYRVEEFFPQFNKAVLKDLWPTLKARAPQGFRKHLSSYQSFSLLRCKPKTGRTHQIRVHLAHLKHPIVGDQTYGGKKRQKLDEAWCVRHFLHAATLQFRHPRTGEQRSVAAPLPDDLQFALRFIAP